MYFPLWNFKWSSTPAQIWPTHHTYLMYADNLGLQRYLDASDFTVTQTSPKGPSILALQGCLLVCVDVHCLFLDWYSFQ